MKDVLGILAGSLLIVFMVAALVFGISFMANSMDAHDERIDTEECAARAELYDAEYRRTKETGCELYISTPQWIRVGP